MKLVYLLSDTFNYSNLICDDAGTGYATAMNWNYLKLSDLKDLNSDTAFVVDNRIEESDLPLLKNIIAENAHLTFLLKIVDPYIENTDHYYYRFLSEMSTARNTYLLSVYTAQELTRKLKDQFVNRFIHLPYPYLQQKEIIFKRERKNKIIIAGSINSVIYPYRYEIWKKVTRSFTRFIFFSILKHPGYIDLRPGQKYGHNITDKNFIDHLSGYKYMLMCPTKFHLELLKFNECAYAGCIPVGLPPDSYPQSVKDVFLSLGAEHFLKDIFNIFFKKHSPQIVATLRNFLHKTRNPDVLNNNLKRFILENPVHTS